MDQPQTNSVTISKEGIAIVESETSISVECQNSKMILKASAEMVVIKSETSAGKWHFFNFHSMIGVNSKAAHKDIRSYQCPDNVTTVIKNTYFFDKMEKKPGGDGRISLITVDKVSLLKLITS